MIYSMLMENTMDKIAVQSISDIITNSSSEIFMIYSDKSVEQVKKLINSILELTGVPYRFDDLFTVEPDFDYDYALDLYHDKYGSDKNPSKEELTNFARGHDLYAADNETPTLIYGIKVIPKNNTELYKKVAEQIEGIPTIFKYEEIYC